MSKQFTLLKSSDQIPGTLGLPFLGETLSLLRTEELFYLKRYQQYGSVFKTRILGKKHIVVIGPEANRFVLLNQDAHLSSEIGWSFLSALFGKGLLLQDGVQHEYTRRLLQPAFHSQAINRYINTIQVIVKGFIRTWKHQNSLALLAEFRKLTLTVASYLFLGSQTPDEVKQTSQWFRELVGGRLVLFRINLPWTRYGRSQLARSQLQEFVKQVIFERQHCKSMNDFQDVLGLLLSSRDEDGNKLTESEVIDQALLLLFAGHETTARLLSWLVYELGIHSHWQERLRSELKQVTGDEPIGLQHLKQLSKMNNVLKEVERLYPPVYGIPRGLIEEMDYAGYRLPSGWKVIVSPLVTHRMRELYSQPNEFDPDRFAPPREEHKKHPFALVGFGGGPHKCLGFEFAQLEMKVVLSTLLHHFRWSASPKRYIVEPILPARKVDRMLRAQLHQIS